LAVQEQPKDIQCPQCYEINPGGSSFCDVCGASLSAERKGHSEGSDTEVYQELARTNLLRMRGEYKKAVTVCLSVLKRYPNNATAHTLLGDIYAEQGDLPHAKEWYELAIDLGTASEIDKKKLESINQRLTDREAARTAQRLGKAQEGHRRSGLMIAGVAGLLVLVAAASYLLGQSINDAKSEIGSSAVRTPIGITNGNGQDANPGEDPENPTVNVAPSLSPPDQSMLALLQGEPSLKDRILTVEEDPRHSLLTVTVLAAPGESTPELAVLIGKEVLGVVDRHQLLTMRIVSGNRLALIADIRTIELKQSIQSLGPDERIEQRWRQLLVQTWPEAGAASL
jgi:hypothetical protein